MPSRPLFKRWQFWAALVGGLIVFVAVLQALGVVTPSERGAAPTSSAEPAVTETAEVAEPTEDAPASDLAERVEREVLENGLVVGSWGEACEGAVDMFWSCRVEAIENGERAGEVVVRVSEYTGAEGSDAARVARGVLQLSCGAVEDLDYVRVVSADGAVEAQMGRHESQVCN